MPKLINFANLIWGPKQGVVKIIRRTLKILICVALAAFVHWILLNWTLSFDSPKKSFESYSSTVKGIVKSKYPSFNFRYCGNKKIFGVEPCKGEKLRDANGILLAITASYEGRAAESEIFVLSPSLVPFIDTPKIIHSTHSITRSIEKVLFNKDDKQFSGLKLCSGTIKKLKESDCELSAKIADKISESLTPYNDWFRFSTLVFGLIQYLTLVVFFFVILESFGRKWRWVNPERTLITQDKDETGMLRNHLKEGEELANAIKAYSSAPVQSIPDRLTARAIALVGSGDISESSNTIGSEGAKAKVAKTTLEGYREFLTNEAESNIDSLHTYNEIVLKLAFVGTIWGISSALFSARELDVADPVTKILAKADMFGSIGTAFGTTLLGVLLSVLASLVIQYLTSSWGHRINSSYESVVSVFDEIDPETYKNNKGDLAHKSTLRPKASFAEKLGMIVIIGVIGLALWWYFTEVYAPGDISNVTGIEFGTFKESISGYIESLLNKVK